MSPGDVLDRLLTLEIEPKKRLSQVFMVDRHVLKYIAQQVADRNPEVVLEIGSGPGNLTRAIIETIERCYLIGVEIDHRFLPLLKELQNRWNVDIVLGDGVAIVESLRRIDVVVGNLPYHIVSELVLAIARSRAKHAVVTIQKEVAERLRARPGTDSYGKLSVIVQLLFDIKLGRYVPSKAFRPEPEVDSMVVLMDRIHSYEPIHKIVEKLILCLFSYRRKILSKALKNCFGNTCVEKVPDNIRNRRVYTLEPEIFLNIAHVCRNEIEARG